jgi:hypothetical protein
MATWRTVDDAQPELLRFIEAYYDAPRLHARNGYMTSTETEADDRPGPAAA